MILLPGNVCCEAVSCSLSVSSSMGVVGLSKKNLVVRELSGARLHSPCSWVSAFQVQLYEWTDGSKHNCLRAIASLSCPGVFDFKWRPGLCTSSINNAVGAAQSQAGAIAALALADGSCMLMEGSKRGVKSVAKAEKATGCGMTLSCDWVPHEQAVLTSSSDGSLSRCIIGEAAFQVVDDWKGHDLEAWVIANDQHMVGPDSTHVLRVSATFQYAFCGEGHACLMFA
jgi:hypothetical protein